THRSVTLKAQAQADKSRLTVAGHGVNDSKQSFIVPLVRLDKVLADQNVDHVDLIKIDVEGFELEVLRGLGERMAQVRNIILEVLPVTPLPIVSEIANLLTTSGFDLRTVDGTAWCPGQPCPEWNVWASRPDYDSTLRSRTMTEDT